MTIYPSYTYHIEWSKHNKHYYGVRLANKCLPENDLWVVYFTSSNIVKKYRKEYGEPDIIQVDKMFETRKDAVEYESSFLKENDCVYSTDWLNQAAWPLIDNRGEKHPLYGKTATPETKRKMSESRTGTTRSAETKEKMSASQSGKNNGFYGRKHNQEALEKISIRSKMMIGSNNANFIGYYITPWGKYESIREAMENTPIGKDAIAKFCKQPQTVITKRMVGNSAYLEYDMIGKTASELGFDFIVKGKE